MRDPTFTDITECQHVAEQAALTSSASLASNQVDVTPEILDTDLNSLPNFFRDTMPPLPGQSGEPSFAAPRDLIDVWTTGRLNTFGLGNRAGLDFDGIDFCFLDTYDNLMPLYLDFESSTNSCTGLTPMTPYDSGELRDEVQSTDRNDVNLNMAFQRYQTGARGLRIRADWETMPTQPQKLHVTTSRNGGLIPPATSIGLLGNSTNLRGIKCSLYLLKRQRLPTPGSSPGNFPR